MVVVSTSYWPEGGDRSPCGSDRPGGRRPRVPRHPRQGRAGRGGRFDPHGRGRRPPAGPARNSSPGIVLAAWGHVGMAEDQGVGDAPAGADIGHEGDHRGDLRLGKRAIAEIMAGIGRSRRRSRRRSDAASRPSRTRLLACQARRSSATSLEDPPVLLAPDSGTRPGRRGSRQPLERRLAGGHAGIVQDDHVRRTPMRASKLGEGRRQAVIRKTGPAL